MEQTVSKRSRTFDFEALELLGENVAENLRSSAKLIYNYIVSELQGD